MIGKTISHYKILEKLGEGGMGVVYKAQDTKLKRTVALKFLPPELTREPAAKERFVREAQAASALDHPYIGTIYEINETEEGQLFIAMACYEGETLKQKIERGPLRMDEAIEFAMQVAEGLAKAHHQGIIHRDIKPANVMVTGEGRVKILDFGLAKLQGQTQFTEAGTTLGTVAYMSPEQLRGEVVDQRTDIWSLGVLIYEMVTGRLPFEGDYEQAVTYSILNEEPEPLTGLRTGVPMDLERIVNKCLQKHASERYQHADELNVDLRRIKKSLGSGERVSVQEMPQPAGTRGKLGWITGGVGVVAGLAIALVVLYWRDDAKLPLRKWLLPLKTQRWEFPVEGGLAPAEPHRVSAAPVISPDGNRVAFVQDNRLCIHDLDQVEAREIPDSEGASLPFWSVRSDYVGYAVPTSSGWMLKKVSVRGGPSTTLCTLSGYDGAAWRSDGTILVSQWPAGLFAVPAQGGEPRPLVLRDPTRREIGILPPLVLPDEETLVFSCVKTNSTCDLYIQTGDKRELLVAAPPGEHLACPLYSPTGHLLYVSFSFSGHQDVWAVPFSMDTKMTTGGPFLVAEDASWPSLSKDGTLVYQRFQFAPDQLVWVDRTGIITDTIGQPHRALSIPALSPDGRQVAVRLWENNNFDVWIYDVVRGTRTRLTSDPAVDEEPAWSPDGDRLAFASYRNGQSELFIKVAGGSGDAQLLVRGDNPDWSPDGKYLVYHVRDPQTNNRDLWYVSLTGDRTPQPFLVTDAQEGYPQFSPDGRYVAYESNETGRWEVYVKSFPSGADTWQVSVNGGESPRWSSQGDELFYVEGNALMVVSVKTQPSFQPGKPQRLFSGGQVSPPLSVWQYDVTADGQRFVMMQNQADEKTTGLTVVQNWYAEFKDKR